MAAAKTTKKSSATKKKASGGAKRQAFGGYSISFKGCDDTLEDVFGSKPIGPSDMTKAIWAYVKKKNLSSK